MNQRTLPSGLSPGRRTPSFTNESVPPALLKAHHTTVWAQLVVERGTVAFCEEDPEWQVRVHAHCAQVIVPNRKHHVEPEPGALFHVQFYESS